MRRPRRNRKSPAIRSLVQETTLLPSDLIQPFFVLDGERKRVPVQSMPGVERLSIDELVKEARGLHERGITSVILFPVIEEGQKDPQGSEALNGQGLLPRAVATLKREIPSLCVIADIALDPYTSHGHDGLVNETGEVLNDETVEVLGRAALVLADAGVDVVAPSDMMDGRVGHIRRLLDDQGHFGVSIMAYSAKYASAFYGPFRDALGSAPRFGDKKTYQMDPANVREAILECLLDEEEGADYLMVKPALPYLDVIAKVREQTTLPIAAYHVSGEYAMLMAAGQNGWLDADRTLFESVLSIKRAGASAVLTYGCARLLAIMNYEC